MKRLFTAHMERGVGSAPGSPLRFIAASGGIKRDGLDLDIAGLDTRAYEANPVVLWVHDYRGERLPVGRTARLVKEKGRLIADIVFDMEDPLGAAIDGKYRRGFLHAVSVGWNPRKTVGNRVIESDLLDISAVPVPGDSDALIQRAYQQRRQSAEARTAAILGMTTGEYTAFVDVLTRDLCTRLGVPYRTPLEHAQDDLNELQELVYQLANHMGVEVNR